MIQRILYKMLRCLLRHPIIAKGQRCTTHTDLTCLVRFCYLMILFIQQKDMLIRKCLSDRDAL